jgi:hypothetical protein
MLSSIALKSSTSFSIVCSFTGSVEVGLTSSLTISVQVFVFSGKFTDEVLVFSIVFQVEELLVEIFQELVETISVELTSCTDQELELV